MVGRVKPGVAICRSLAGEAERAGAAGVCARPDAFSGRNGQGQLPKVHVVLTPGGGGIQAMQEEYASNLQLLMSISGLVLLIACANIANLLLARGMSAEGGDVGADGAGRGARTRIVRQLLTESLVLAGVSGIAGLAWPMRGRGCCWRWPFRERRACRSRRARRCAVLGFALRRCRC